MNGMWVENKSVMISNRTMIINGEKSNPEMLGIIFRPNWSKGSVSKYKIFANGCSHIGLT